MGTFASSVTERVEHPVRVVVEPARGARNRLTVAFRVILALPHFLLVGGPIAAAWAWSESGNAMTDFDWSLGGGVLGAVAFVCAVIGWFAILFTGEYPKGLRSLVTYYMRWRVRASAYAALLRDEYPPFGDAAYPAQFQFTGAARERNRLTVAFRPVLAIPQLIVTSVLGFAWGFVTVIAWFAILFTGEYPRGMYRFATQVLQWSTRVEAYILLLHDEYPPFTLED